MYCAAPNHYTYKASADVQKVGIVKTVQPAINTDKLGTDSIEEIIVWSIHFHESGHLKTSFNH